jgi:ProP effector
MIIRGIKVKSLFKHPSELELLRAVIWDIPRAERDKILEIISSDEKASANFKIVLANWDNDFSSSLLAELIETILIHRLGGHNGVTVAFRKRDKMWLKVSRPPRWDDNCNIAGAYQILHTIRERWPDIFSAESPVPLKIGIYRDILKELNCNPRDLKIALGLHCRSEKYLKALKLSGARRLDLNGNVVEEVTREQAALAKRQLGGE